MFIDSMTHWGRQMAMRHSLRSSPHNPPPNGPKLALMTTTTRPLQALINKAEWKSRLRRQKDSVVKNFRSGPTVRRQVTLVENCENENLCKIIFFPEAILIKASEGRVVVVTDGSFGPFRCGGGN